jgi:hypothetical protein
MKASESVDGRQGIFHGRITCAGPMARKAAPKPDDPEQSKRFIETAEEVGADRDDEALERAFKKIAERKHPKPTDRA